MNESKLLRPFDLSGTALDASFRVDRIGDKFVLFFASRGGSLGTTSARNTQYHLGLGVLLRRLQLLGASLTDAVLDSTRARKYSVEHRRLHLPAEFQLPLSLAGVEDIDRLRLAISDAQRTVVSASESNPRHGNRVRSIRLSFVLDATETWSAEELAIFLVGEDPLLPSLDPIEVVQRASRLATRGRIARPNGSEKPKVVVSGSSRRHLRLPAVACYVLQRADGKCELCDETPFRTDHGEPFLEVHHLRGLADGGPDTPDNAAALCPNCHRELHYGANRRERLKALRARVAELSPLGRLENRATDRHSRPDERRRDRIGKALT